MTEPKENPVTQAAEAAKAYEDAIAKMTDPVIAAHVRAYHPSASASKEQAEAMLADYERIKAERDAGGEKPMGTTG